MKRLLIFVFALLSLPAFSQMGITDYDTIQAKKVQADSALWIKYLEKGGTDVLLTHIDGKVGYVLPSEMLLTGFDSTGFVITIPQVAGLQDSITGLRADIQTTAAVTTWINANEADPLFTRWNKSTGISIAKSQVTDLARLKLTELDSTAFRVTKSQVTGLEAIDAHIENTDNPHGVTKAQVGLGNVTNDAQVKRTEMGAANGVATLNADGKLPSSQVPPLAITETFVVSDESDKLVLTQADRGDVAIVTSTNTSYILQTEPYSVEENWAKILTPDAPVNSVNGQTGNVSLDTDDIPEGSNLYYTEERVAANSAVQANTAKVTNATHTGDVTGSTELTLQTVNSNVGTFNNVTVNAKGLVTAASNVGYLTSFTESDPVFGASPANGITSTNIANWTTAYGWGDHSQAGYLTGFTESDPVFTAWDKDYGDLTNKPVMVKEDYEAQTNGDDSFTLSFSALAGHGTVVYFNGSVLRENQYTVSAGTVTVLLPTLQYDKISITYFKN